LVSVLNPLGKICLILSGPEAQALDVGGLMPIRGTVTWELMFTRPRTGVELEKQGQILNRVATLLDSGVLVTTMTQCLSWHDIQVAHRQIETGHTVGKIVLEVD
jgi:NADPH:quinone reductase-like Zn-dependent oxidoreductase